MRKNTTRKLAASLALLLSVNCMTPALAGINTFSPGFLRNTVSASPGNASPGNASPGNADIATPSILARATTLTDVSQLEPYFPDPIFRQVVFDALVDEGQINGADMEEILAEYTGEIKYGKKTKP